MAIAMGAAAGSGVLDFACFLTATFSASRSCCPRSNPESISVCQPTCRPSSACSNLASWARRWCARRIAGPTTTPKRRTHCISFSSTLVRAHNVSGRTPKNTYESCSVSAYYRSLLSQVCPASPPPHRPHPALPTLPPCKCPGDDVPLGRKHSGPPELRAPHLQVGGTRTVRRLPLC